MRAPPCPADAARVPDQRPPWAHSHGQANIAAVGASTDTDYYDYADYSGDGDYGDNGDYRDYDYESHQASPPTESKFQQQPVYCSYAQPQPPSPPQQQRPSFYG